MHVTTVGLDLAENVLQVHGVTADGTIAVRVATETGGGDKVILMRMHAAGRQQAEHVYRTARGYGAIDGRSVAFIVVEAAVGYGLVNAGDILVDDAPRPKAHMSDLRVSHLALGQTHIQS